MAKTVQKKDAAMTLAMAGTSLKRMRTRGRAMAPALALEGCPGFDKAVVSRWGEPIPFAVPTPFLIGSR